MKTTGQQQNAEAPAFLDILDGTGTPLDPMAGISIEEQEEILAQINGIAEKNRMSLSGGAEAGKRTRFAAKKNGGLFPVLVNLFMLAALAVGFFALSRFQNVADAQAREGTRVFNPVERALIAEIRRETDGLLAAADREIARLLSPLADVERRLRDLAADGEALGQAEDRELLLARQEELHAKLELARQERSRILDEARSMEMALQAQRDARVYEYDAGPGDTGIAAGIETDTDAAATARAELERLSREWAQAAAVEAQITAFLASAYRQIGENSMDEVERTVGTLREFMNVPAFLAIAPSRRELHTQAVDVLEAMLGEYRAAHATVLAEAPPPETGTELRLQEEIAALERLLGERDDTIDTLGAGIAGSEQALAQLRNTNAALAAQVSTLQGTLFEREHLWQEADNIRQEADGLRGDTENLQYYIRMLRAENVTLNQAVGSLQTQNEGLSHQLTQIREAVQRMSQ